MHDSEYKVFLNKYLYFLFFSLVLLVVIFSAESSYHFFRGDLGDSSISSSCTGELLPTSDSTNCCSPLTAIFNSQLNNYSCVDLTHSSSSSSACINVSGSVSDITNHNCCFPYGPVENSPGQYFCGSCVQVDNPLILSSDSCCAGLTIVHDTILNTDYCRLLSSSSSISNNSSISSSSCAGEFSSFPSLIEPNPCCSPYVLHGPDPVLGTYICGSSMMSSSSSSSCIGAGGLSSGGLSSNCCDGLLPIPSSIFPGYVECLPSSSSFSSSVISSSFSSSNSSHISSCPSGSHSDGTIIPDGYPSYSYCCSGTEYSTTSNGGETMRICGNQPSCLPDGYPNPQQVCCYGTYQEQIGSTYVTACISSSSSFSSSISSSLSSLSNPSFWQFWR